MNVGFVLPLAVGDPEDIASPVPLGFQGDGFSLELHKNTAASQPPNENHMLEPNTQRAVRAASLPWFGGRHGWLSWASAENVDSRSGSCLATRTPSGLMEPRAGAPKASSVWLIFLTAIKNDLRQYFKIHIK